MASSRENPSSSSSPSSPAKPASRLLVVDDEPAVLEFLRALLSRSRYEVTTAESASEARRILDRETQAFDCVITDAIMPEVTGYAFVASLRTDPRYAQLPVLMLTRKRHRKDVKLAVEAGVTDYVLKPIDDALLLEKLKLCLSKRGVQA
jgi:DNA-binding response OmpR family regulator